MWLLLSASTSSGDSLVLKVQFSVLCTLNADPLEVVGHKHLYIITSGSIYMCTLYHSFKRNTALLPLLLALYVWVVQQNLVWTSFFDRFSCLWWCLFPYAVLLLCFLTSPEVRRSLSSMKSFNFSHYSCYIQYKVWRHRYTVLSVFLLTLFAINGMHVY